MLTNVLRTQIEGLSPEAFTSCMTCIEEIQAALKKSGPTALIAMNYCKAKQEESLAATVVTQHLRITKMSEEGAELANKLGATEACHEEVRLAYEATYKKLEQAQKKLKKLRK